MDFRLNIRFTSLKLPITGIRRRNTKKSAPSGIRKPNSISITHAHGISQRAELAKLENLNFYGSVYMYKLLCTFVSKI
jgi:hypothetical protein